MVNDPALANQQKILANEGKIEGNQAKVEDQESQDVGLGAVKGNGPEVPAVGGAFAAAGRIISMQPRRSGVDATKEVRCLEKGILNRGNAMMSDGHTTPIPGEDLKAEKMPGHWLLARLGKRVLRPGGRQMTGRMIEALNIRPSDAVIEFAPGLGETARLTLKQKPASYTAVERDKDAAAMVRKFSRDQNNAAWWASQRTQGCLTHRPRSSTAKPCSRCKLLSRSRGLFEKRAGC